MSDFPASPRALRQARQRGDLALSSTLVLFASVLGLLFALWVSRAAWNDWLQRLPELLRACLQEPALPGLSSCLRLFEGAVRPALLTLLLPFCAGLLAWLAQTRLNLVSRFSRPSAWPSRRSLLARTSALGLGLLCVLVAIALTLWLARASAQGETAMAMLIRGVVLLVGMLALLSLLELGLVRGLHRAALAMTRRQVMDEQREEQPAHQRAPRTQSQGRLVLVCDPSTGVAVLVEQFASSARCLRACHGLSGEQRREMAIAQEAILFEDGPLARALAAPLTRRQACVGLGRVWAELSPETHRAKRQADSAAGRK